MLPRKRVTTPVPQPLSRTVFGLETGPWTMRSFTRATTARFWSWSESALLGL